MMKELEVVALTHDILEYDLKEGDIGTIVFLHDSSHYEVEFVTAGGQTIAVLTLTNQDIRSFKPKEILHVRSLDHVAA